jgi:cell division GTPase FtsZ
MSNGWGGEIMEPKNLLRHGFIGIGQGGGNILNSGFYSDFPVMVINTAEADVKGLKNIPSDCKYIAGVTHGGGAGKEIAVGEQAIIVHRDEIIKRITTLFKSCEYLWVTVGMGGGTGTLGAIQMIEILTELGMPHGIIATVPLEHEGTIEKANCLVGLTQIYQASRQSNFFKGIILIDNKQLKNAIMNHGNGFSYESLWEMANNEIYAKFNAMYSFTEQAGQTCLDIEDYKRIFKEKGCMLFAEAEVDPAGNSEYSLALSVMEMWNNSFFITGDILAGKAIGIVVERPRDFDKDGILIDRLFSELKQHFKAGLIATGVYKSSLNLQETLRLKRKPVRIKAVVSGIPFPAAYLKELNEKAQKEIQILEEKEGREEDLGIDLNFLTGFLKKSSDAKPAQKIDLSVFNRREEKSSGWRIEYKD